MGPAVSTLKSSGKSITMHCQGLAMHTFFPIHSEWPIQGLPNDPLLVTGR